MEGYMSNTMNIEPGISTTFNNIDEVDILEIIKESDDYNYLVTLGLKDDIDKFVVSLYNSKLLDISTILIYLKNISNSKSKVTCQRHMIGIVNNYFALYSDPKTRYIVEDVDTDRELWQLFEEVKDIVYDESYDEVKTELIQYYVGEVAREIINIKDHIKLDIKEKFLVTNENMEIDLKITQYELKKYIDDFSLKVSDIFVNYKDIIFKDVLFTEILDKTTENVKNESKMFSSELIKDLKFIGIVIPSAFALGMISIIAEKLIRGVFKTNYLEKVDKAETFRDLAWAKLIYKSHGVAMWITVSVIIAVITYGLYSYIKRKRYKSITDIKELVKQSEIKGKQIQLSLTNVKNEEIEKMNTNIDNLLNKIITLKK